MSLHNILFGAALVGYFLGAVLFLANLFLKHARLNNAALGVSLFGVMCHTGNIILRVARDQTPPFSTTAEAWSFLSWAVAAVFLSISVRPRLRPVGAFALPAALIGALTAAATGSREHPMLPGVSTWGLWLHVPASILSLGAFVVAFACAVCYLIQDRLLRRKQFGGMLRALPPLDALDAASYWLVVFGFCFLTVGLITGAILAQDAWRTSWLQHPKSYVSVLLWITYGIYLYVRGVANWRGRRTHTVVVVAVVILTAFYASTTLMTGPASAAAGHDSTSGLPHPHAPSP